MAATRFVGAIEYYGDCVMDYLIGGCVGGVLTVIALPFLLNLVFLILWGLGFIDMGLNSTTPNWLKRLREKIKR